MSCKSSGLTKQNGKLVLEVNTGFSELYFFVLYSLTCSLHKHKNYFFFNAFEE